MCRAAVTFKRTLGDITCNRSIYTVCCVVGFQNDVVWELHVIVVYIFCWGLAFKKKGRYCTVYHVEPTTWAIHRERSEIQMPLHSIGIVLCNI